MPKHEGKVNDSSVSFHPTPLGILLSRMCHIMDWHWKSIAEEGTKKQNPYQRLRIGPIEYERTSYTYTLGIPKDGTLERMLETPNQEHIQITPYLRPEQEQYSIHIERNTKFRGKGKPNTKVHVSKIYGKQKREEQDFWLYNLNGIEHYVREFLK